MEHFQIQLYFCVEFFNNLKKNNLKVMGVGATIHENSHTTPVLGIEQPLSEGWLSLGYIDGKNFLVLWRLLELPDWGLASLL